MNNLVFESKTPNPNIVASTANAVNGNSGTVDWLVAVSGLFTVDGNSVAEKLLPFRFSNAIVIDPVVV
ncbi:hypothetical protein [Candidatus Nitrosotalea sp. TS]|uniref:hypothetical protein n=1 Tax=Candidatus Nitrosotalea sp. TS TaxID=2341020 RepID=UPI001409AAF1|nr:hypothetical protein [Candidatus Nitrosotalea sp. TS]